METRGRSNGEGFLSRMALNDNKAGMVGLDRDKINKVIMETSKGSRFYESELKKEQQVNQRIEKMMLQKAHITDTQLKKAQVQVERLTFDLERSRNLSRVIVHVDMDAFYAAVEMRDCPDLKDKPMAVGSMSMLSTSNYHARRFGVRAAMPGFIAKKLCPDLVIVPTNFDKYRAVSAEIRAIFADYDPHFQPLSLDEAYLDFTDHLEQRESWPEAPRTHHVRSSILGAGEVQGELQQEAAVEEVEDLSPVLFEDSPGSSPCLQASGEAAEVRGEDVEVFGTSAEEAVREMRFRIEQKTTLTASAGIAPNMMLAKVCSDKNKPNGQYRLPSTRDAVMDFMKDLPVRKVFGIGKVSEKLLGAVGIITCAHLGQQMALLSLLFSETSWHHFIRISLGLGSTHIERDGERKSMSTERTFREMTIAEEQLSLCRELCQDLSVDLAKEGLKGKTVTLKLKNVDFEVTTRALTLPCGISTAEEMFAAAKDLLRTEIDSASPLPLRLRLMGVRISTFVSSDDKKPLQKSIVGFLQQGRADPGTLTPSVQSRPSACLPLVFQQQQHQQEAQEGQRQGKEMPWLARQMGAEAGGTGEQQRSFFQRAHAQRLRLQAESTNTPADLRHGNNSSTITVEASSQRGRDSPPKTQESKSTCSASDGALPATTPAFPTEARASTSGWGTRDTESLTCPVCFGEVETTDLDVFNGHIDLCLSGVSTKPAVITDTDSDSDTVSEKMVPPSSRHTVETEEGLHVAEEGVREEVKQIEDPSAAKPSEPQCKLSFSERSMNRSETALKRGSFETNGGRPQPVQSKECEGGMASSRGVSSLPNACPGTVTSHGVTKNPALTCPVCHVTQETDDLTALNRHVDLCLNQEVLHELGGRTSDQPSVSLSHSRRPLTSKERNQPPLKPTKKGKSKRRGSPPPPPSKKVRALGSLNTIDKFFR